MDLDEQYKLYFTAYSLVTEGEFDILHLDVLANEVWLEKYENKTSKVVRLIQKGFDWKNHLRRDIANVFQKSKAMQRLLQGKHVEIYNVYVSSHAPIDDWEVLKKPMQLKEKNPLKMKVYYLDDEDASAELGRLRRDLHLQEKDSSLETDKEMKEAEVTSCKNFLADTLEKKNREVENVFSHGKPYVTYLLIVINVLMYIFLELSGGSSSIDTLIELGAKYNPDIINGEWWRIISSMFLHIGFLHLAMNMLAIFYLGTAVERIYGGTRFLIIYFLAGIGGGLASFAFTTSVSAGASGAIFGLFGALLFFGLIYKRIFLQTIGQNILFILLINIVFGFLVAQIDMGAHLGGLLAGFIASAVVHLPQKRAYKLQIPAFLLYLLFIAGLITFGIANNVNSQSYQLMQMEQLLADEKYEEAVDIATRALDMEGDLEAPILFQRSYAYIELTEIDRAITDLEQSIQSKNPLPEAYYNLALLYFNDGRIEEAREMISNAFEMEPEVEAYKSLYEEITGESP